MRARPHTARNRSRRAARSLPCFPSRLLPTSPTLIFLPLLVATLIELPHRDPISPSGCFSSLSGGASSAFASHSSTFFHRPSSPTCVSLVGASPAPSPSTLLAHPDGRLAVADSSGSLLWFSNNTRPASAVRLLDTGNLLLLSSSGALVWQSFDHPADTWLSDMAVTPGRPLVSWRSVSDPSPGRYSLRLRGGEFDLVFDGSARYWSIGNWTGKQFAGVPEMTVPYIYRFQFSDPFGPNASFSYSVNATPTEGVYPPLTRFVVDFSGQLMQYTWSPQRASWDMFWSRPDNACQVYGRCGNLGHCVGGLHLCDCPSRLRPADLAAWSSGDYSRGCFRGDDSSCSTDEFEDIGTVEGEWVKQALTALIRLSSHQQRRRAAFQPQPSATTAGIVPPC